ncbi:RNA 3'-terminal phosphate cyclase-like protein isoform X1 [Seriola aureovittata]|uniref:RNA 3'-terminal phosphate cyclase-like protein isoform X1 n=2 Tax=Seriola aureovittata TaxID=2871759 RepID=UPI0024BDCF6A|nr:RNA 3'-terminal phosphate cyclase-like protein isoform X1 [Seriola aureovittata]
MKQSALDAQPRLDRSRFSFFPKEMRNVTKSGRVFSRQSKLSLDPDFYFPQPRRKQKEEEEKEEEEEDENCTPVQWRRGQMKMQFPDDAHRAKLVPFCNFEASFIRLLDKVTNGSRIEINQTGTVLFYQPGLLFGGTVEHDCNPQRSIGYYLEALLMLAPFMKNSLKATLRGVTNDSVDPTVDLLKSTALPLMKKFGIDGEGFDLKVVKRGMAPGGGGEVVFTCPVRRTIRPVQLTDPGKIKRIRGVAYSVRVSPQMANRIVDSARAILNQFLPDIYIYTDHMKGANSGKSPGFGLTLVAETLNGSFISAEMSSTPQGQGDPVLPEDLGRNCAKLLLEEVHRGGCVDSSNQSLALLLMTLGQQDVSKVLLGPLSPYTIEFLRHIRDFFQIMFKIEVQKPLEDERKGGDKVLMTCVGVGYSNINKGLK